jgi:hypothetical protein
VQPTGPGPFAGHSAFDSDSTAAHANFDWLVTAVRYVDVVARYARQRDGLPDWLAILLISDKFVGEAAHWFAALKMRQQYMLKQAPMLLSAELNGDINESLAHFKRAFVQRWTPTRFPLMVKAEFDRLVLVGSSPAAVRAFMSSFDLLYAKMRLLEVGAYRSVDLAYRIEDAMERAPAVLQFLRTTEVDVGQRDEDGRVLKVLADSSFEAMVEGLRRWLQVATQRGGSQARGAGAQLRALGVDVDDTGGADETAGDESSEFGEDAIEHDAQMDAHWTSLCSLRASFTDELSEEVHAHLAAVEASTKALLKCYNCGKEGHIGRMCDQPRTEAYERFLAEAKRTRETEAAGRLKGGMRGGRPMGRGGGRGRGRVPGSG